MSDDIGEVEEITAICGGLNINIGTLNERTIRSMLAAGKKANALGHPVILDPVGAGASSLRTQTAHLLLDEIQFSVIRGNISEIKTLALGSGTTKGVDADVSDNITDETADTVIAFAKAFSKKSGAVVAITGAIDIVADSEKAFLIKNGVPKMSKITGSGCMLTAMTAAYITANSENTLTAAAASVCAMGLCGERAYETMKKNNAGNSSFRNYLIDESTGWTARPLKAVQNMKFAKESLLLYAVTDRTWLNGRSLYDDVKAALKGGVTMVQLREKELSFDEFLCEAKEIKTLCARYPGSVPHQR